MQTPKEALTIIIRNTLCHMLNAKRLSLTVRDHCEILLKNVHFTSFWRQIIEWKRNVLLSLEYWSRTLYLGLASSSDPDFYFYFSIQLSLKVLWENLMQENGIKPHISLFIFFLSLCPLPQFVFKIRYLIFSNSGHFQKMVEISRCSFYLHSQKLMNETRREWKRRLYSFLCISSFGIH